MADKVVFFGILGVALLVIVAGMILMSVNPVVIVACCCGGGGIPTLFLLRWLSTNTAPASGVQWGGKK